MSTVKNKRSRPKSTKIEEELVDFAALTAPPPPRGRPPAPTPEPPIDNLNILNKDSHIELNKDSHIEPISVDKPSIKALLTDKELTFIENYLIGTLTIEEAMISAGYHGYHPNSLYRAARKIVQRYEESTEGRRILRASGFGEVAVSRQMSHLARSSRSEVVQLRAVELAAKCLGMMETESQANQGVTVIIQALEGPQQINLQVPSPVEATTYNHPQPAKPGGTVQITK